MFVGIGLVSNEEELLFRCECSAWKFPRLYSGDCGELIYDTGNNPPACHFFYQSERPPLMTTQCETEAERIKVYRKNDTLYIFEMECE